MRDKLSHFVVIAFLIYVSYVNSVKAITCFSCKDELACQRTSQYNATKDCADQCVTIFSGFLPIKKSCLSDLTTDENQLCSDTTNPLCYKCNADNCNNLGRIDHKCIVCSTDSGNSNCLQNPMEITDTRCPAPISDEIYCYVNSIGNQTIRGCMSSPRNIDECFSNSSNCSLCSVNEAASCNNYPYPTDRRKCLTCSGSNCRSSNSETSSLFCLNPNDDCISINNYRDFKQVCASEMSSTDSEFCKNNNLSCSACNSNDCNTEFPRAPDDIDCYSCEGLSCLRSSLYNVTTFCDKTDKCVTLFDGFTPTRKTCYARLTADEKAQCDDVADTSCYTCNGTKCNNLGRENHLCISCSSEDSDSCLQDPTQTQITRCAAPISEDVYCYVNSSSTSTTRGCVASTRELYNCTQNNATCSVCPVDSSKPCNSYAYPTNRRKCLQCDGTHCNSTSTLSLFCQEPDDTCVSINNFGKYTQACAKEITSSDISFCSAHKLSCTTCDSNDCNSAFPSSPDSYIECFSCEGISCQRSTLYNHTRECAKTDTCVTLFENYIPAKKTCYNNLSSEEKLICDDTSNPLCYKCSANQCNNLGRIDHKCITCSTATSSNCLQDPKSIQGERCPAPISDDAYCFVTSVGNTVTRGCLRTPLEIGSCDNNNLQCSMCSVTNTTACNTYEFPSGRRQCHSLRGSNTNTVPTTQSKYCAYADDSCLIIKSNGTLSQICSRDMNATEIGICHNHRECCSTCSVSNCNVQIPTAQCSSNAHTHNGISFVVAFISFVSFLKFHAC